MGWAVVKKIVLTIEFNEDDVACSIDTHQGDPLSPADFGQAAGVLLMASRGLQETMSDTYFAEGRFQALADLRDHYEKAIQQGERGRKAVVSKEAPKAEGRGL